MIPPATLLIESPAAVVETSVARHGNRELATSFLAFLWSRRAAHLGRLRLPPVKPRRRPSRQAAQCPDLFTMTELGGWDTVQDEVYGPAGLWTSIFSAQTKGR